MSANATKLQQLFRLVIMMQSGDAGNAAQLAEQFGVSERTIYRYLEDLKDVGVPCYFDEHAGTYRIRRDFFLPPLSLTAGETLALTCLVEQIAGSEQIALTGPAARAVEKVRAAVSDRVRGQVGDVDEHMAIRLPPTGPAGDTIDDVFDRIRRAIHRRQAVRCRYESLNRQTDPQEPFIFKPYALSFEQRSWYAIGEHTGRGEVRLLKLNRFTCIEPTSEAYAIPADFSLDAFRGNAWRMIRGTATYRVVIHFDAAMAETVGDTHWHRTQEIDDHEDGSITFRCEVDGLDEIVWWVLGYGPGAKVLAPAELADRVAELAAATVAKYGDRH